jgi:hypothetical protein
MPPDTDNADILGAIFLALYTDLGIPLSCLPASSMQICEILTIFLIEYEQETSGGLTRATVLKQLRPFDSHIHSHLAYASDKQLVQLSHT